MIKDFERQWSALVGATGVIGPVTTVQWPVEGVGEGKAAGVALLTLASFVSSGFSTAAFARLAIPVVDNAGARIDVELSRPGLVKFVAPASTPVELTAPGPNEGLFFRDPDDPGTVYVDASGLGSCIVSQGPLAFAMHCNGVELSVAPVTRDAHVTMPPFEEWMREYPDRWLCREAETRAARGSLWDVAVAVGLSARLLAPDSKERRGALVADAQSNRVIAALAAPRLWARARSKQELDTLERAAATEAAELTSAMPVLAETVNPDDPAWVDAQLRLRHRRDDLEGVRLLLHEATGQDRIGVLLEGVDRVGKPWSLSLPVFDGDERLRRVSDDPEAWWAH